MKNILKQFLDTTDNFLCDRIKNVFDTTQIQYKNQHQEVNLEKELQNFQENPLGCVIGLHSKFETAIKLKIKFIIGLFFVFIPIIAFSLLCYLTNINVVFAFLATLPVAFLVSSRMEALSKRYVQLHSLHPTH
ncbi:hypothetical protein [Sulfurimonas sp.]|uniref:hypothetical protein n=1 Tax=Sulfurimonas sp. TaxID=2022749 RepID=UPI002610DD53|nr:hypothetical protein [Sulfurimonas sp.]